MSWTDINRLAEKYESLKHMGLEVISINTEAEVETFTVRFPPDIPMTSESVMALKEPLRELYINDVTIHSIVDLAVANGWTRERMLEEALIHVVRSRALYVDALKQKLEQTWPIVYLGTIPGHPGGTGLIKTTDGPDDDGA